MISLAANYVNFPAAVAEAGNIEKGEEMEWPIHDKDTYP